MAPTSTPVGVPGVEPTDDLLDRAIDRLAELQAAERQIESERKALRERVEYALRREGVRTRTTAAGHVATVYSRTSTTVDRSYLAEVLTAEQLARAIHAVVTDSLRIS